MLLKQGSSYSLDHFKYGFVCLTPGTVHKQGHKITNLEKENNQLKKEIERLKKELAAKRVTPQWVKPNKSKVKIKNAKKKGPKLGYAPHS